MSDTNSKGPTFNLPKPEPALLRHASNLYEAMMDEVIVTEFKGENYDIYNGFLGKTFAKCGISNQYYKKVLNLLEEYGCIATIEKGVRNSPTRAAMLRHPRHAEIPSEALGIKPRPTAENSLPKGLTDSGELATLKQSVRNLAEQIGGVNLKSELVAIERRLSALEGDRGEVLTNGKRS